MRFSSASLDTSAIQRSCLLLVLAVTLLIAGTELNATTTSAKPNIVILLADDLGRNDVGYHGSEIKTPHIDRLAQEGLELDRFYVAPYCCPTRAGLMTGRYPHRFGYPYTSKLFGNSSLPQRAETLAEMLGTAGYRRRACIGKWHLSGRRNGRHPLDQGFDHFYGLLGGMVDYFSHKTVPFCRQCETRARLASK
jgi:arylsulfatase B